MITILESACFSLPNIRKQKNEDSILAPIQNRNDDIFFAIADGVGSLEGSDAASQSVIYSLLNSINDRHFSIADLFKDAYDCVSNISGNIATTLTIVHINEYNITIGHIGDCRAYYLKGNSLEQMTTDHTKYQDLINSGEYKSHQLRKHKTRLSSVLTSAIAKDYTLNYDIQSYPIKDIEHDGVLVMYLMSDGAYHHWDKRKRFSEKTMSSPSAFSSSLKKRIEKDITDDYSLVGVKIKTR